MTTKRWKHLYETRPRELKDWALDELAGELAKQLAVWPPPGLDWIDITEQARLRPVLERESRPPIETIRVALELARLELLHQIERVDFFLRSAEKSSLLPDSVEEQSALFVSRWLVEACLSIQDAAPGKLKRKDLVELIERLEKRLLETRAPLRI
jgi:hypothetical protein